MNKRNKRDGPSTPRVAKRLARGKRLNSQAKYIVENVRKFFEGEKSKGSKGLAVVNRTARATGLAVCTVKRIHAEFINQDQHFLTPVKRYTVSRIRVNADSFDRAVFRRIINNFYVRKEYPTLSKVLERVKEDCGFPGGRFCLWRILKEMGYSYKKKDDKQFLYEQRHILEQRHNYLQQIIKLRKDNANLIYLDETWVNAHHSNDYIWVDSDNKGGWKVPSGKGKRLIVLHAGGEKGWVDGVDLVFTSKTNSADYHDEMNSDHFLEWMTDQLLPTLDEPSVIILDNASYHNKQRDRPPTTQTNKDEIRKWLDNHNIEYKTTDIKKILLNKVKQYRKKPIYLTDELANDSGHEVLRLPVGHCELNPIELAWASVKGYVAKHNTQYNMTGIQCLVPEGFKHTTADMWKNFCRHVHAIEKNYIKKDGIVEDTLEEMVINIGEDESDDEEDEEDLLDESDRRMINTALRQHNSTQQHMTTSPVKSNICTSPRRELANLLDKYDSQFLENVLPLP